VVRDQLYSLLRSAAQTEPELTNQLVTDALVAFVSREEKPPTKPTTEEPERPVDYQTRLSSILSASSALPVETDLEVRRRILAHLVVLAHHQQICEFCKFVFFSAQRLAVSRSGLFSTSLDRDLPEGERGSPRTRRGEVG
jgi:hypothetical protein